MSYESDALKAIQARLDAMRMTRRELDTMFISYLVGAAPGAVERALDFVEQRINDESDAVLRSVRDVTP